MKNTIANFIRNLLPSGIRYRINKPLQSEIKKLNYEISRRRNSYGQEGEDLILARLFSDKTQGFYVDVGAFQPILYSNTFRFYELGWRGINIDARPGSMKAFAEKRPRDINIETAVGTNTSDEIVYFLFEDGAYNTTREEVAERLIQNNETRLLEKTKVRIRTLEEILDEHVPHGQVIDFMSVDVEGADLNVLQSNNWHRYNPSVLLVESYGKTILDDLDSEVYKYLSGFGYQIIAKTVNTLFLRQTAG